MNSVIENKNKKALIDNSKLMVEAFARAGADVFIGYPITPANLLYLYSSRRFPMFFAAPDEITTLQWMSGFAATGKLPVTATSFPGYALMIESINMAAMMELPMVIVLVQRLGPATGTATCGAQGDISVVNGTMSGGFPIPTISISNAKDCWDIAAKSVEIALELRTPVVLLTSKEEVMTQISIDLSQFAEIKAVERKYYTGPEPFIPYKAKENLVPEFLPVTNNKHQVRITASTHDKFGIIQNVEQEAIDNSKRLNDKIFKNIDKFLFYNLDEDKSAKTLIVSYGITSRAACEAVNTLRKDGKKVSSLVIKTLFPVHPIYFEICDKYEKIIFAEENLNGQYRQIMFGTRSNPKVHGVNSFGKMINPHDIINKVEEVERNK